ncbi:MAG: helix-turn-helix domain-containing protein [Chitinivibrionia bacterium]|jgi:cytoskeletal protein RodZ|nr:helix-turn-helix domain-containing protein [Chitinivibrionia bacterium]
MSEKLDALAEETPKSDKISIGGTIRKQRISMNISIDKISRDLKINKTYVQAIEDDKHELLPALPYVRGYIKAIGEYLSIDSTKLLKQFSSEEENNSNGNGNGAKSNTSSAKDNRDSGKQESDKDETINVSMSEQKKGKNYSFPILLLVLLGVLAYFAANFGTFGDENIYDEEIVSTESEALVPPDESDENEFGEGEEGADGAAVAQTPSIELVVNLARDSSAIEVINDGVLTRNRTFSRPYRFTETARDTLAIRLGAPMAAELTFNGNSVARSGSRPTNWLFTNDGNFRTITFNEWQRLRERATAP